MQEASFDTGMHDSVPMCHWCTTYMNSECVSWNVETHPLHTITPISTLMVTICPYICLSIPVYNIVTFLNLFETDFLLRYMYIHLGVSSSEC